MFYYGTKDFFVQMEVKERYHVLNVTVDYNGYHHAYFFEGENMQTEFEAWLDNIFVSKIKTSEDYKDLLEKMVYFFNIYVDNMAKKPFLLIGNNWEYDKELYVLSIGETMPDNAVAFALVKPREETIIELYPCTAQNRIDSVCGMANDYINLNKKTRKDIDWKVIEIE